MLGGSVVIENVFSIPGIGAILVSSINLKDIPQVMAITILFSFTFCLVTVSYTHLDVYKRQDHVGVSSRLGHEDILHYQELEPLQRLAGMVGVGLAQDRVFTHDQHALDFSVVGGIHRLRQDVYKRQREMIPEEVAEEAGLTAAVKGWTKKKPSPLSVP